MKEPLGRPRAIKLLSSTRELNYPCGPPGKPVHSGGLRASVERAWHEPLRSGDRRSGAWRRLAQEGDASNSANNPLTLSIIFDFHDYYVPDIRDRENVKLMTVQPIATYNLPQGCYLRSSAILSFDFENDNHFIPLGLGIGNVWKVDRRTTANLFIEPQYTVWHDGLGMPRWQIFVGLNLQFSTGQ